MLLSRKTKEAIKTALAMTIAYGIALSMDWDRPYWAGFAVAFISLSTIGQSLNKGGMRMLGTLLALVVSLLIIALFAQDRWWFMVALSGWIGFCTYRMVVSRHSYFWFLAGFASAVIAFDGGLNPINAFDTAMIRAQETGLGILVYTLITTLLWPNNSHAKFEDSTWALVQLQHRLYSGYREVMIGHTLEKNTPDQDTQETTDQQVQAIAQFSSILEAALTDSYEVWELRDQWHRFQGQSMALHEILDRWHGSSKELEEIDLNMLLPKLGDAMMEFELRFVDIERLLAGEALKHQPQPIDLSCDHTRLHALSHFHKATFMLARTGLQRLDRLTLDQLDTVVEIKGLADATHVSVPASVMPSNLPRIALFPDADGMIAAFRAMLSIWLAYLLWIYIEVPDGSGIVSAAGSIGMTLAASPRISVLSIIKPIMLSIVFAGILYVFVMPQLSSFVGLGTMIFFIVFAIAYLFSKPQQGLIRSIALAFFLIIIGVSNSSQQYDILSVINTALMLIMLIGVLILASYFPSSPHPDKVFLRLLGRFFHSSEYLITRMHHGLMPIRLDYWKQVFHVREVSTLPKKLGDWGPAIDTQRLPGTTPAQLQVLTTSLQALAYHIQEVLNEYERPQSQFLMEELLVDFRPWHIGMQASFRRLAKVEPTAGEREALVNRLKEYMEQLELRIKEALDKAAEGQSSDQEVENFYRLLAGYRGISGALIGYAGSAGDIDWAIWHEERF